MSEPTRKDLKEYFAKLEDSRIDRSKRHGALPWYGVNDVSGRNPPRRTDITFPVWRAMPICVCSPYGVIGTSKTVFIGPWIWSVVKTRVEFAQVMLPTTWCWYDTLPSIC